jgi:hypothetical protein
MKKVIAIAMVLAINLVTEQTNADFTFGTPTNLGPTINSSYGEAVSSISADGLMLYFTSDRPDGYGGADIWVTRRPTIVDDWGIPENLGTPVNTSQHELFSCISTDGLELYFDSHNRPGGYGSGSYAYDIWVAKRPTRNDVWGIPINLGTTVNTGGVEGAPRLSADGLELYFTDYNRAGGYGIDDIWVTRRATKNDPWEQPINLGAVVNSSSSEDHPFLSEDGLALFFSEDRGHPLRPGGFGNGDMWVTIRSSNSEPWGTPVNLGPIVNSTSLDGAPVISPDGFTLYFSSERPGGFGGAWGDIYQASITPIVDFNGDEIVDSTDMCIMIDHWGEDYSLCDIGPMPWGDGVVDIQDLIVLAEHLFEDYRLLAHWALDEEMGNIAYNSVDENYGTLQGEPLWQPTEGKINGALLFDGIDDCVVAGSPLNPADGDFSVFVWVKGDTPGQVILSQTYAANWLCTDSVEGYLMTGLKAAGRGGASLLSRTSITDNNWHHIGFVWDGSHRHLYVDGVEVANDDEQLPGLASMGAGLFIGTGCYHEPGTFFSGLIDDVRIYNQALTAEQIAALAQ